MTSLSNDSKKFLKKILIFFGLFRFVRIILRRRISYNYYKNKINLLKKWAYLDTEDSNFYYEITDHNKNILINLISFITKKNKNLIKQYFNELDSDFKLKNYLTQKIKKLGYGNDAVINYGRRIGWYALARALKPRVIVETGVSHGIGSCILCKALQNNIKEGYEGYYYGTEKDLEAGKLFLQKYKKIGKILYGDSIGTLKKFNLKIDLFINDSDHSADYEYLEYNTILNKISKKCIILGDNCHVTNKLWLFSEEQKRKFLYFHEEPLNHWYPGAGIGISFR